MPIGWTASTPPFPQLRRVIFQSDNAKNFAGKVTKMFIHQAVSACGMNLIAYYHNKAAAGKDICDSHFSHQQSRVEAYISEGEGGRKVSTPKRLAIALSTKCVKNTTVLLVKPKYDPPFMTAKVAPINGISTFLAATYSHHAMETGIQFVTNLYMFRRPRLTTIFVGGLRQSMVSAPTHVRMYHE